MCFCYPGEGVEVRKSSARTDIFLTYCHRWIGFGSGSWKLRAWWADVNVSKILVPISVTQKKVLK